MNVLKWAGEFTAIPNWYYVLNAMVSFIFLMWFFVQSFKNIIKKNKNYKITHNNPGNNFPPKFKKTVKSDTSDNHRCRTQNKTTDFTTKPTICSNVHYKDDQTQQYADKNSHVVDKSITR